jgi:hypothetical protein
MHLIMNVALENTLYPQNLAPTSPTSGGRSVGIVRVRTKSHAVFFCRTRNDSSVTSPLTERVPHLEFFVPENPLNENEIYIKLEH